MKALRCLALIIVQVFCVSAYSGNSICRKITGSRRMGPTTMLVFCIRKTYLKPGMGEGCISWILALKRQSQVDLWVKSLRSVGLQHPFQCTSRATRETRSGKKQNIKTTKKKKMFVIRSVKGKLYVHVNISLTCIYCQWLLYLMLTSPSPDAPREIASCHQLTLMNF